MLVEKLYAERKVVSYAVKLYEEEHKYLKSLAEKIRITADIDITTLAAKQEEFMTKTIAAKYSDIE